MTRHECRRCDWTADPDGEIRPAEQLGEHARAAGHWLCGVCGQSLAEHDPALACERCLTVAQGNLSGIVTMYGELGEHLGHLNGSLRPQTGRSTDGKPLPGGTVLVLLSHGSEGLRDDIKTALEGDPPSISYELGWWAMAWSEDRGDRDDFGTTPARIVLKAGGYLERRMRWAANGHPGFAQFAADLARLHHTLERALGGGLPREKANAACFTCGGALYRLYSPTTGLADDHVTCVACGDTYDPARYALALRGAMDAGYEVWLHLEDAARSARVPVGTLYAWINRDRVQSRIECGKRQVWWPDVWRRAKKAS